MNVRSDVRKFAKWIILDYINKKNHDKKIEWHVGRDVSFCVMTIAGDYVDNLKTKELCFDDVVYGSKI